MSSPETDAYHELMAYTLGHGNVAFIHQHVVDAWAAQHASADDKPIRPAFALVGLYLKIERGFTGRQVQKAHMQLAQRKQSWPLLTLPEHRGDVTALEVMAAAPGEARDRAVDAWCHSVWTEFENNREAIVELLKRNQII